MNTSKALILSSLFSLNAHAFTNLDFESVLPFEPNGPIQFLDWSVAAPGWSHSAGDDTDSVYYGAPHVGISQWFLLAGEGSWSAPLAGNYSLVFKSGNSDSQGEGSWVNAYIAQSGIIPENTNSIQLLATGPISVTIGGNLIALSDLGNNLYRGDVSAYAGLNEELRITNIANGIYTPITIDNIEFLSVPVPASAWLFGSSLIGLVATTHKRKAQ